MTLHQRTSTADSHTVGCSNDGVTLSANAHDPVQVSVGLRDAECGSEGLASDFACAYASIHQWFNSVDRDAGDKANRYDFDVATGRSRALADHGPPQCTIGGDLLSNESRDNMSWRA
jgi:hypothetical protein